MSAETEPHTSEDETGATRPSPRRRWHAPQFIVSDLAATDSVCNGMGDATPGSLS
jgi:hypothetical protein